MPNSLGFTDSAEQIASNYQKYKEYYKENKNDALGQDAFLALMVEQMKNQDIMNPTDNSEYIAQMAQFSSLTEMQNVAYYSNANYASSLVGKTVALNAFDKFSGENTADIGLVESVKMEGKDFSIIVNGKPYAIDSVTQIMAGSSSDTTTNPDNSTSNSEGSSTVELPFADNEYSDVIANGGGDQAFDNNSTSSETTQIPSNNLPSSGGIILGSDSAESAFDNNNGYSNNSSSLPMSGGILLG